MIQQVKLFAAAPTTPSIPEKDSSNLEIEADAVKEELVFNVEKF